MTDHPRPRRLDPAALLRPGPVLATGSHLMDIHGIGPAGAARILADVGDVTRFPDRGRFASWIGTAPVDASSGQHIRPLCSAPEPQDEPCPVHGRYRAAAQRHSGPPLLPAPPGRRQDTDGGDALPAPPLRCRLPPALAGRHAQGRPGRAVGGVYVIQRGRPHPGHRLFGSATSRTCGPDATPARHGREDIWSGHRRPDARAGGLNVRRPTGRTTSTPTSAAAPLRACRAQS